MFPPLLLAGCATWGPTWSEVSGAHYYNRATLYRLPARIARIDDQGAFAQNPIKIEPGRHEIQVEGTLPGWMGATIETIMLDVLPCKRYFVNAQYANLLQPRFTPVIDYVEDIAGCRVMAAAK
jgi:hypothetical protein